MEKVYEEVKKTCRDCQSEFTISPSEHEFFATAVAKETNEPMKMPSRCKPCRALNKKRKNSPFNAMRGKETPGMGVGVGEQGQE